MDYYTTKSPIIQPADPSIPIRTLVCRWHRTNCPPPGRGLARACVTGGGYLNSEHRTLNSNKKPRRMAGFLNSVFNIDNWIYSGDDLLFRGLSQSTIGDTGFPCLVRDGTEGGSRSIITRINPANIIITILESIVNVLFKHSSDKSQTIR